MAVVGEYYWCKKIPCTPVSSGQAYVAYSEIVQLTYVNSGLVRFDCLTGGQKHINNFVANETELNQKFTKITESEAKSMIASQMKYYLQPYCYYIAQSSFNDGSVKVDKGDVLYVQSMTPNPNWANSTNYDIVLKIESGRSKNSIITRCQESHLSTLSLSFLFDNYGGGDYSIVKDAIKESDQRYQQQITEQSKSNVVTPQKQESTPEKQTSRKINYSKVFAVLVLLGTGYAIYRYAKE